MYVRITDGSHSHVCTFDEVRQGNAEDMETLSALERLEAGSSVEVLGGGAQPLVRLEHVTYCPCARHAGECGRLVWLRLTYCADCTLHCDHAEADAALSTLKGEQS